MREITRHLPFFGASTDVHALSITATDDPGPGGANHAYLIESGEFAHMAVIRFQNGPIAEKGVNGVTNEALLAIVLDRLDSFQRGPYGCSENAMAHESVTAALEWLHMRTRARVARGVEGTSIV